MGNLPKVIPLIWFGSYATKPAKIITLSNMIDMTTKARTTFNRREYLKLIPLNSMANAINMLTMNIELTSIYLNISGAPRMVMQFKSLPQYKW